MLKSLGSISRTHSVELWRHNYFKHELMRWYRVKPKGPYGHTRKPMWLGTAKTKLTRIPQWAPYRPGELSEMTKLFNDYKCLTKSLFQYFKDEYDKVSDTSDVAAVRQRAEEEEHVRLMERNRQENERIAKMREERVSKELQEKKETMMYAFIREEKLEQERLAEIEERVRIEKERAKTFITPETLDEAIERALETEVDYNFAITLDGTVYKGRNTRPDTQDESKIMKLRPVAHLN